MTRVDQLPEIEEFDVEDLLECYFCEKEIHEHKEVDGKLFCERIDKDTKKPFEYRAWQDVMDSEEIYTDLHYGHDEIAYKFKMLPPNVPIFAQSGKLVEAVWKDKDPKHTYSSYLHHRGVKLLHNIMNNHKKEYFEDIKVVKIN